MFRGVFKWRQASVAEVRAKKRVRTKIGRLIRIPDDASDRYLFNLPVQATGADGFKPAPINIPKKLNGPDARIIHTQHDEIIVKAGEDIAHQVRATVKGAMEEAFKKIIPEVTFIVEPKISDSWKS